MVGITVVIAKGVGHSFSLLSSLLSATETSYWRKRKGEAVIYSFDQYHYDYWINHSLPVILTLYHPTDDRIIWQHITPETCVSTGKRWKVEVPLRQELSLDAITSLSRLAQEPSLRDRVLRDQKRLERLDPRFRPHISATEHGSRVYYEATEDFQFTIEVKGEPGVIKDKIIDLVERGRAIAFQKDEIEFSGSPLFDKYPNDLKGPIVIQCALKRPATLSLLAIDVRGTEKARIDGMPATLTAGTKALTVKGAFPRAPLTVTIEGGTDSSGRKGGAKLTFDPKAWCGCSLLHLPYFDAIDRLFNALRTGAVLGIECHIEGNMAFSFAATKNSEWLDPFLYLVEVLSKARFVARHFGINPLLPQLSQTEADEVERLFALLKTGEVSLDAPRQCIKCPMIVGKDIASVLKTREWEEPTSLKLVPQHPQHLPFLGANVEIGPIVIEATNMHFTNRKSVLRRLETCGGGRKTNLIFKGAEDSKRIWRLKESSSDMD